MKSIDKEIISIRQRTGPHALAMKYIHMNLGLNLLAKVVEEGPVDPIVKVQIDANVPIECSECGKIKRYEYIENVGYLRIDKEQKKVIYASSESWIESQIENELGIREWLAKNKVDQD